MIGPSSSHTAGAARLARVARSIVGKPYNKVEFYLHGSFAQTYKGHGTDRALVAGALGFNESDDRLCTSFAIADEMGLAYSFQPVELEGAHENTVMMKFYQDDKLLSTITGSSIGGGNIIITNIDGFDIQFSGKFTTIILKHRDQKGIVGEVGTTLLADRINIANMSLNRTGKGLEATTIIETDEPVSDHTIELLKQIEGVLDINQYLGGAPVYNFGYELLAVAKEKNMRISEVVLLNETEQTGRTPEEVKNRLWDYYEVMVNSATSAIEQPRDTMGMMIKGDAQKMNKYMLSGNTISGDFMNKMMARALSCSEVNASMGPARCRPPPVPPAADTPAFSPGPSRSTAAGGRGSPKTSPRPWKTRPATHSKRHAPFHRRGSPAVSSHTTSNSAASLRQISARPRRYVSVHVS